MDIFSRINKEKIKNPERFLASEHDELKELLEGELNFIKNQIDKWIDKNGLEAFPTAAGDDNQQYGKEKNEGGWTQGFFTGSIWLLYQWTGESKYLEIGKEHVANFRRRLDKRLGVDHHDLGFLYSTSCVAAYKSTGDKIGKETAIKAADLMANERYLDTIKAIDRGRFRGVPEHHSKFIIDCVMNVPLMYWASTETGDPNYKEKAYQHMLESVKLAIREDGSCFQGVTKDRHTGELIKQDGDQGYNSESYWSRGHAWAIYGTILTYNYTGDTRFLTLCKKLCNFYMNRLPEDDICTWDLIFTDMETTKDTSAAVTCICGMLELAKQLPVIDKERVIYERCALKMLKTLVEKYSAKNVVGSTGLLLGGVYVHGIEEGPRARKSYGEDTVCAWGDYFYTEAIMRVLTPLKVCW